MRKPFSIACLLVLIIGVFIGCHSTDKNEATKSTSQTPAANAETKPGEQHQYRAVCITKAKHDDDEYMISRWLDNKDEAEALGQAHIKDTGHRLRIDERVKP